MASVNKVILIELADAYLNRMMSIPDVASEYGFSYYAARKLLLGLGIELRSRADGVRAAANKLSSAHAGRRRAPFSASHRHSISVARRRAASSGLSYRSEGYVQHTTGENKGRSLHVTKMEAHLGRRLLPNEVVHHIDGNRHNNDISNLRLMSRSEHTRHHRREQKNGKR